jgi:hypothetical protein
MNLSGNNIKKYILRRYSIDELESIFNQKLNNQSRNFKHYAHMSSNKFMVIVVSLITEEILVQLTDGWVEDSPIPEEGLYEFIQEIFGERIIKKYDELTNMNLQESIRRILREELSPRIRRRVPADEMEKEFIESFNNAYDIIKRRKLLSKTFLELTYTTISMMMDSFHWRFVSTLPEDEFWYDEIHNELENHYRERIIKMYKEREGI